MPKSTGSNTKERPKTAGSGRKKGTPNKATVIRNEADRVSDMHRRYRLLIGDMYELARKGSVQAAKIWIDSYHGTLCNVFKQANSLDSLVSVGETAVLKMLNGEWPVSTKQLLDAISWQKTLIEGQLTPIVDGLIKERLDQMKMKD